MKVAKHHLSAACSALSSLRARLDRTKITQSCLLAVPLSSTRVLCRMLWPLYLELMVKESLADAACTYVRAFLPSGFLHAVPALPAIPVGAC